MGAVEASYNRLTSLANNALKAEREYSNSAALSLSLLLSSKSQWLPKRTKNTHTHKIIIFQLYTKASDE